MLAAAGQERVATSARLIFIDNLRWVMIVLVITMHAAVTYSNMGRWYYNEKADLGLGSRIFFIIWQTWLQAFFMGLLFFVAGYVVPRGFDRKGLARFLRDRAIRLGIPSLLYLFVIGPLTIYYLLVLPAGSKVSFPRWWARYVTSSDLRSGGTGPLWFCVALLIFCVIYAVVRAVAHRPVVTRPWVPEDRHVLLFFAVMAAATFSVRIVQPIGAAVWNMQLCYFSQYVLLFTAGIHAYRHGWLLQLPRELGTRWFRLALTVGSVWFIALLVSALKFHWGDTVMGGLHWGSALLSGWESFFCVGICLGLIVIFRERFNTQPPLARFFSDNAFAVYVIHPPVVIGAALALRQFQAPPVAKFAIVSAIGVVVSFGLAAALRQLPLVKRVF
jgi:glucan biosynthesis protein C